MKAMRNNRLPLSSEKWAEELDMIVQDVQVETLRFTIFGLIAGALTILLGFIYIPGLFWTYQMVIGLTLLAGIVWFIHRRSFILAAWLLVLGVITAILVFISKGGISSAIFLLIIPVGLSTLIITRLAGFFISSLISLILLLPTSNLINADSFEKALTIVLAWCIYGMIWITFRPLINILRWSWTGYRTNQVLLEKNQEYQVQLLQTLERLKDSNIQLTRLNTLAQNLRVTAEEERKTKEQFVATVSHELRTPLNMIIGFCEMITQSPDSYDRALPPALLADLKVVLRNSQHLSSLIDDVLDLSQIEAGQMKLVREKVVLADIINSVTIAVRPLFESKSLFLHTDIAKDLREIYCDKKRIREVLLNLLSNAGRFTDNGGVTIKAWQENNYVYVSVRDTGKGIDPKTKDKLFEPFQQLDVSIRQRYGGTGLGLAISKQFIELHDGKIWVESQEISGTNFVFRLPVMPPAIGDPGALRWFNPYQTYEEKKPLVSPPSITIPPRVILVEKGNTLNRLLSRHWENLEVVSVQDFHSAMDIHEECPAQLILVNSDEIPHLDIDAKVDCLDKFVPLVHLNIPGSDSISEKLSVQDYLLKPISSQTLISAIKNLGMPVRKILLVDDEPDTLQLFSRILTSSKNGYQVSRAMNGKQALEIMEMNCPDLILLDLTMPVMDGFETLEEISKNPSYCQIPVILTSARDPIQEPAASKYLTVTSKGGLSLQLLLDMIAAINTVFTNHGRPAVLKNQEKPTG